MKYVFLLSTLLNLTLCTFINAQDISSIRQKYTAIKKNISMQKQIKEMENNCILTFRHNVPGIGPQTFTYELFFSPHNMDSSGNILAHKLQLVQCKYNIAARTFYEEYLYDDLGTPIFIYKREPEENGEVDFIDRRMYYYKSQLIKLVTSTISEGNSNIVANNVNEKDLEKYLHQTFIKAKSIYQMFISINKNANSNNPK